MVTSETMLIDIHVHTSISRSLPFRHADMLAQVARARQQGLDACALTDHSDAADILAIHDALDELVSRLRTVQGSLDDKDRLRELFAHGRALRERVHG